MHCGQVRSMTSCQARDDRHSTWQWISFARLLVRAFIIRLEREWRIVSQEIPDDHPRLGVREGRFVLIPYFEFPLTTAKEKLDVEIVVGPNREMDLAIASLTTLLNRNNCRSSIRASAVPYRDL